jgi:ketosteroid isomerase-like protein
VAQGTVRNLIDAGIEAFNGEDHERLLGLVTDDVEWKRVDGLPDGGGVIHGREALRAHLQPDVYDRARFEIVEVVEGDDVALVHGVYHARGAGSGVELDIDTYIVYRLRGDLACAVENWRAREDAERSAALAFSGS